MGDAIGARITFGRMASRIGADVPGILDRRIQYWEKPGLLGST